MTDGKTVLAESQALEAANAAAVATEAQHKATAAQVEVAVENAIAKFFDRGVAEKKFIDVGRIPFICDDINGLRNEMTDVKHEMVGVNSTLKKWDETRVTRDAFDALDSRTTAIQDNITWGVRVVIGAVLLAVVALAVKL